MKRNCKKILSLMLVLMLALGMIGGTVTVSYAATPYVKDYCGDLWVWAGGTGRTWVWTSEAVTSVTLQKLVSGSWQNYTNCTATDADKDYWVGYVDTAESELGSNMSFRFAVKYSGGTMYSNAFTIHVTNELYYTTRIAGANRFETALLASYVVGDLTVSEADPESYQNVVIASGFDFADALGGTFLAARYDAPILLVNNSTAVMDKIATDMGVKIPTGGKVFILGGYGAVPQYMETALKANGVSEGQIKRFAGANRYDTNLQILQYCNVSTEELMICCGNDFADALSASALGYPVVLVGKTLTDQQKTYFKTLNPEYVNMIGGEGAVPAAIKDWFDANGFRTWRYKGANRYETSAMLAYDYFQHQSYFVLLAYSLDFPDGLSAGPLAYQLGAPLLLVNNSNYMYAERFVLDNDCRFGITFGGPSLVSDYTFKRVMTSEDLFAAGAPAAARGPEYTGRDADPEPAPSWSKRSLEN